MFSRRMTLIAGLMIAALMGLAGSSTAQTFAVKAEATTRGYTGTYSDSNSGTTSAEAESNPGGLQFNNGYGLVYAETYASSNAAQARLAGTARATATRITATAFTNSNPYSSFDTYFTDTITVRSDTLAAGTPVTLVFRHQVGLTWQGSGNYTGSLYSSLRVGGTTVSTRWDKTQRTTTDPGVASQTITIQTTVGSRITMTGILRGYATARYLEQGYGFNGSINVEGTAGCILESTTPGVTVVADSGRDYTLL